MKIIDIVYVKELKVHVIHGREMLHLGDTCKREEKYARFVYTETNAAIK